MTAHALTRETHGSRGSETIPQAPSHVTTYDAADQAAIVVPSAAFLSNAHYVRHGSDLYAADTHGTTIVVRGYFTADHAPDLVTADGARAVTPAIVHAFAESSTPGQYAQLGTPAIGPQIGQVSELSGRVFDVHADGTRVELGTGDPLYQGDVIETAGGASAVRILLIDQTTFAIGPDARLALDQITFNPQDNSGEVSFSMLKGVFIFTSGLVAHHDPSHMVVNTPVALIGIRGTVVSGNLDDLGGQFTVLHGTIQVETHAGSVTMSESGATTQVTNINAPPASVFVMSPGEYAAIYKAVSSVAPGVYLQPAHPDNQDGTPGHEGFNQLYDGHGGSVGHSVATLFGPGLNSPGAFDAPSQIPNLAAQFQQLQDLLTTAPAASLPELTHNTAAPPEVTQAAAPTLFDFSGAGGPVNFLGNDRDETVIGSPFADHIDTQGGNDTITGNNGNDTLLGGPGNDTIFADNGGASGPVVHDFVTTAAIPVLVDGQAVPASEVNGVNQADLTLQADNPVSVIFESETAGQQNSLGYYKIGPNGEISDVQMVWTNASASGSGGNLQAGDSVQLNLGASDRFALFMVSDGAQLNNFSQFQNGTFEFRDANGNPATVGTADPVLYFVSNDGLTATEVRGAVFHTAGPTLNTDGIEHTISGMGSTPDQLIIGFEDFPGGGDHDYQDLVVAVQISPATATNTDADFVDGGPGNDLLVGGPGDTLLGGDGNDLFQVKDLTFTQIAGGQGTDTLQFTGSNTSFNLTQLAPGKITGIEKVDLSSVHNATLTIDANTVLSITDGVNALTGDSHDLVIAGDASDKVAAGNGWTETGTTTINGEGYTVYQHDSGAKITVDQHVAVT